MGPISETACPIKLKIEISSSPSLIIPHSKFKLNRKRWGFIFSFFWVIWHGMTLNPNGQYGNVPLLHALVSGFYLVYLALLIHWSNFADTIPSLATRWGSIQPLLRWQSLPIHISPFVCCWVSLSCWLAARREQIMPIYDYFMLDNYYDKHHNHCLQA